MQYVGLLCVSFRKKIRPIFLWLLATVGLPVSRGEATAKARVVTSLQAATEIQVWRFVDNIVLRRTSLTYMCA